MTFKPLLASPTTNDDLKALSFPVLWSPKLDGIRLLINEHGAVSRKLMLLPNEKLRKFFEVPELLNFDGEIVYGPSTAPNVFHHTQSCVMRVDGPCPTEGQGTFLVFDDFSRPEDPYSERYARLVQRISRLPEPLRHHVRAVPHLPVYNLDDLRNVEGLCVSKGFEGIMLRNLKGRYKYGRSTLREGILLKVKRFEDFDARIKSVYEMMHNGNVAEKDALGHTKRSSHQENKIGTGLLGGFIVESDEFPGAEIKVGPGNADHATRKHLWEIRDQLPGKVVVAKHQPSGMKDAPRFATFKAFRKD